MSEEEYVVEKVIGARGAGDDKEYRVKWKGYSVKEATWEPARNLANSMALVRASEKTVKPAAASPKRKTVSAHSSSKKKKRKTPVKRKGQTKLEPAIKEARESGGEGGIEFLVALTEDTEEWLPNEQVKERYADILFDFYESKLRFE